MEVRKEGECVYVYLLWGVMSVCEVLEEGDARSTCMSGGHSSSSIQR